MRILFRFILFVLSSLPLGAQLLPSIGLNSIPLASAPVCKEPFYLGNFYSTGFHKGDTVPDFKLYGLNGDSLSLSQALASGKPALLIAGSLTCPVFRAKVSTINQVASTYSAFLNVYVIYTLEAHPTDTSVYFGYVNVTSQNNSAGILFKQPQNYGERKAIVDTMGTYVNLTVPVFIDGPCNAWWKKFGPAPNNSYLIGTNGTVLNKHGWFHKFPDNIYCDLDSIFNFNSGLCIAPPAIPGNFSITVKNNIATGMPGDLLYDYVDIVNTASVVTGIKIKKLLTSLPQGWQSAFCADVCYGATDDSIEISVDPFDTIHFSLDIFTDVVADSGSVKVGFKNINKANNSFSLWLKGSTIQQDVGLESPGNFDIIQVYPNPTSGLITLQGEHESAIVSLRDVTGKEVPVLRDTGTINVGHLQDGVYFLTLKTSSGPVTKRIILSNK